MKRKYFLGVTTLLVIFFVASIVRCEILTYTHKDEFIDEYKQTSMIENVDYLKILDYSDEEAKVYYVSENEEAGNIITFQKENYSWIMKNWETIWSTTGSADGFVWPYIR